MDDWLGLWDNADTKIFIIETEDNNMAKKNVRIGFRQQAYYIPSVIARRAEPDVAIPFLFAARGIRIATPLHFRRREKRGLVRNDRKAELSRYPYYFFLAFCIIFFS